MILEVSKITGSKILLACPDCGRERFIPKANIARHNGRIPFCRICYLKHLPFNGGTHNAVWKGGRFTNKDGYIVVWIEQGSPYQAMAFGRDQNYTLEHRLIMAKHLGRCLASYEEVHHINNIRDDNRLKNLELTPSKNTHRLITKMSGKIAELEDKIIELETENILLRENNNEHFTKNLP